MLPTHRHVLKELVSTKDSDYTQFLGLVRARRCSTGKNRRGIALVASEQVSLAHGAPIAARGSPRLSRSTHCGSILAHIESAGARPRVAATTRCCGGRCFGGIAREHCGSVGNCNGGGAAAERTRLWSRRLWRSRRWGPMMRWHSANDASTGAGDESCTRALSLCFPITFSTVVISEELNYSLVFRPRQQSSSNHFHQRPRMIHPPVVTPDASSC